MMKNKILFLKKIKDFFNFSSEWKSLPILIKLTVILIWVEFFNLILILLILRKYFVD